MAWLPLIFDGAGRLASLSLPTALVGACWLPGRNHRPKTYTERDALKFEEVKKKLKKYLLDRNRRENWNLEVLTRMQETLLGAVPFPKVPGQGRQGPSVGNALHRTLCCVQGFLCWVVPYSRDRSHMLHAGAVNCGSFKL